MTVRIDRTKIMKSNMQSFLIFTLLLGVLPLVAQGQGNENNNGHEVKGRQAILKIAAPSSAILDQIKQLGDADDFRPLSNALNLYVLHSKSENATALLNSLKNHPSVVYVEPDYIVKVSVTPNDPGFPQQWSLLNTATPGADIGATNAWAISTGSTTNVVGVVDTGMDYAHPDLAANVWSAPAAFTVNLSWGSITCPAGSHGYNAITRSCTPMDDNGHGTHVSGTIGAVGNNATGVAGVNWTTRIMALKFLDSTGSGAVSDAIDGIEFALQAKTIFGNAANVRVFSNSWGGSGFSQGLLDEINKVNSANGLFVVAAGNSTQNDDTTPTYPASYVAPNLVTVAATTSTDTLASFSNFGLTTVHLGAPGVNILSTWPNSQYANLSGTSMATPHVSGAAMLVLSACNLSTAALKNALLANVDPLPSLAGITVTGGRLDVNKAIRSCAGGSSGPSGTAAFIKTDTTTAGSWKGVYGADGFNVINDTASYPSYVTVTPAGNYNYSWAPSTADLRGLQKAAASDRIAACWYSGSAFTVDLSFKDTATHQIAVYSLDWDRLGRTQRVDILDANNNVLDTRSAAGYSGGEYLVWNLSGHVILRFVNTTASFNAVVSGLFFGAGGSSGSSGTAAFIKTDTTTAGSWKGVYGADGFNVVDNTASYPSYVTVTPSGISDYIWTSSTADLRGLQKASATDRIAACWYSGSSFTVDLTFKDTSTHQVAMYLLDWDRLGRTQRVDILDANNNVLDTRSAAGYSGGEYLVWNLSGHVILRFVNTTASFNAVLSGLFFGAGGSSGTTGTATFIKTDTTTAGSWKGVYGADGFNVINDTTSYPSYVNVSPSGMSDYIWASSTADLRGLQKAAATDRIAACWYSGSSMTVDLSFKDTATHQVAVYLLDWDRLGRTQRVDILDANNNVLDSRLTAGYSGGEYLVWNLSGHVILRFVNTTASFNAVLSGLFFR